MGGPQSNMAGVIVEQVRTQAAQGRTVWKERRRPSARQGGRPARSGPADMTLHFQPLKRRKNKALWFKPLSPRCFVMAVVMN